MDYTSLKNFIIGMRYHDIAKSLWFSAKDHTVKGYYILKNSSFDENVAINSLLHHEYYFDENFYNVYMKNTQEELPFYITFSEYIDRLSSVAMGTEPENISNYPISAQNPFSRLPVIFKEIPLKAIGNSESAEPLSKLLKHKFTEENNFVKQLFEQLDSGLYNDLPNNLIDLLDDYMKISPQRSYPPDNDVSLYSHNVLAAIMAMILCCNIEKNSLNKDLLTIKIGKPLFMLKKVDSSLINNCLRENLNSKIVRINFTGLEELFSESKGINDFLGLQGMMLDLKKSFKKEFSSIFLKEIGFEITTENIPLIDPLNEFPFDLIYLLPDVKKIDLKKIVLDNYRQIFYKLINEIMSQQEICPKDPVNIPYISIVDYGITIENVIATTEDIIKSYSQKIVDAYKECIRKESLSGIGLTEIIPQRDNLIFVPCTVCQRNKVVEEFNNIKTSLPKGLCDEEEKLCLFCITRRIKAYEYKKVTDEFLNMVTVEYRNSSEILFSLNNSDTLPPKAILKAKGEEGEQVDMGILFVRHKKGSKSGDTKVFPTLNYSADKDSNIALIEFYPDMKSLLANYNYDLDKIKPIGSLFNLIDDDEIKRNLNDLALFVNKIKEDNTNDLDKFTSHKHLTILIEDIIFLLNEYEKLYRKNNLITEVLKYNKRGSEVTNDLKCLDALVKFYREGLRNKNEISNLAEGKLAPNNKSLSELLDNFIRLDEHVPKDYKLTGFLDRHNFMKYYAYVAACYYRKVYKNGLTPDKLKECQSVQVHMGRVLSRINWIENFYKKFYEELKEENIAVLPIEKNYPRALFTIPANQLDEVLTVFHKTVAKELFSFSYDYDGDQKQLFRKDYLDFIEDILPPVLYMAVTVFKCKQPVAIAMETSKNIIKSLDEEAKTWHGVKAGFVDMRGSFNPFGPLDAKADFVELIKVLDIVKELPRGVILNTYSEDKEYRDACLKIQAKKHGWSRETFDIAKKNFNLLWLLKKVMKE